MSEYSTDFEKWFKSKGGKMTLPACPLPELIKVIVWEGYKARRAQEGTVAALATAERLIEALRLCSSVMCDGSRFVSYSQQKAAADDARALLAELDKATTR
jgi:hypothetical protein